MTSNQKKMAALLAILFLLLGIGCVGWLWGTMAPGLIVTDPASPDPELKTIWKVALWLIQLGTGAKVIFAALLTAIAAGVATLGDIYKQKWQIALVVVLSLAGIALSVLANVDIGDERILSALSYYSSFQSNADLKQAANAFFVAMIGWFSAFIIAQLGISAVKAEGWVKKLLGI